MIKEKKIRTEVTGMDVYRTQRGITWVESLIILICIGALAAFLYPLLHTPPHRDRSNCMSNQRQIALTMQMYAQDNNGILPGKPTWYGNTITSSHMQWVTETAISKYAQVCSDDEKSTLSYGLAADLAGGTFSTDNDAVSSPILVYQYILLTADARSISKSDTRHADGLIFDAADISQNRHYHGFIASFLDGHVAFINPQVKGTLVDAVDATITPVTLTSSDILYQGADHLFIIDGEHEKVSGSGFTSADAGRTEYFAFYCQSVPKSGQGITIHAPGGPVMLRNPKPGNIYTLFVTPKNATSKIAATLKKTTLTITNDRS